ncbi:MAG: asparagine synthetase B, partial [bacterium]
MCGINGFNWPDQELVKKMNIKLKHRGPDGDGFYVDDQVSLGHARLAILDLSDKAKQPMASHNGRYIIVFNGEIYNFAEIKVELSALGHQFISTSDTEVLVNAWQEWGPDCLPKLNGIFAFAIWDNQEK